jgi:methylenetetrahydrofolate dehydrogenase (NADP+)/methenyltetrahydrofolate cyclohydrolase
MTGNELAEEIRVNIRNQIEKRKLKLKLAVILIGNDSASEKYVAIKEKACREVGIDFELFRFNESASQKEVLNKIEKLNRDHRITGIIVQLPLPGNLVPNEVLEAIDPIKDVDGLNSENLGKLVKGLEGLFPATPEGIINLFRYYQINLVGKKVVVVGQSNLVGRPLALMLLNEKATVFVANSKTVKLKGLTNSADIVISAVGSPKLIQANMVKKDAVIIDVGTTVVDNKIVGDVDFEKVFKKASYLTPNPGGVGPMTVAMLLSNILKAESLKNV